VTDPRFVYNLCRRPDWLAAEKRGRYEGSADDRRDGFIHFSTAAQVAESATRHRAGVADLVLLIVEASRLGPALKWEPSRGGQLFPHLYGPLRIGDVTAVHDLPLGPDGRHVFPALT
jgi:uncharacterized protein (DUF952 family)